MRPEQIKVGTTYQKGGKASTQRRVLAIGVEHRPSQFFGPAGTEPPADEPGVLFEHNRFGLVQERLHLSLFARWADSQVTPKTKAA